MEGFVLFIIVVAVLVFGQWLADESSKNCR